MFILAAAVVAAAAAAAPASAFTATPKGRYVVRPPPSSSDRNLNFFSDRPRHTSLRTTEIKYAPSNQLFDEFLKAKERRGALMATQMFQQADTVIIEAIVQTMEKLPIKKNQNIFKQGEASDGSIYIVASGTFECVDEGTSEVKKECRTSDVFGEISPKFGTKRALTVKASSDDATVWKIPYQDFTDRIKSKTAAFDSSLVAAIEGNPDYAEYFAMKERSDTFQKIPLFKSLQPRDFDEVVRSASLRHVGEGEVLFNEGDQGDIMYIVKEGSVNIFSKKILKTCKKGEIFGEFAIFFSSSNQRQAGALAAESSQVWEIHRDVFFEAVQESDLSKQALDVYRDAYKDKSFSFEELWEYLKIKSRPKKKPVSFHSTFTIFSTGVACAALGQLLNPGIGDDGFFHVFDMNQNLSESSMLLFQISAWMLAASGVMGILRLPPNSPNNRKLLFQVWMWSNISEAAVLSSNFNSHPTAWWYDGFELPGASLLLATSIPTYAYTFLLVDDAIAGSNKGRASNPLFSNQGQAVAFSLLTVALLFPEQVIYVPYIFASNSAEYSRLVTVPSTEHGMNAILPTIQLFGVVQSSLGALFATLQFEKKIDPKTGAAIAFSALFLLNYDGLVPVFNTDPAFPTMKEFYSVFPPFTFVFFGSLVATILNAIRKRAQLSE